MDQEKIGRWNEWARVLVEGHEENKERLTKLEDGKADCREELLGKIAKLEKEQGKLKTAIKTGIYVLAGTGLSLLGLILYEVWRVLIKRG